MGLVWMKAEAFVKKWAKVQQKESAAQSYETI
jgi:hypothetical protein